MDINATHETKRRGRGPGKKPKMAHVSMRISQETFDYYKHFANPTVTMRDVLSEHAKRHAHKFIEVDGSE